MVKFRVNISVNIEIKGVTLEFDSTTNLEFVGNKAKGRISKRVFKNAKHAKISEKQTFLTPCAYQGVRNVCFSEILACFAFLKHPF